MDTQEELHRRLIEAAARAGQERYVLRLYVAGNSARSQRAISNLQRICESHLPGRVDLEIIDIYQDVGQVTSDQDVVAVPMLVKTLPQPLRRLIGDLSDEGRVLLALDLAHDHEEGQK
jgi:circadian clock protein KaiB